MRVAAMAVMVGASAFSKDPMSCSTGDGGDISVTWSIPDGPGARGVALVGCHDWDRRLSDDHASLGAGWQRCALQAWRQDGLLRVQSTPVVIEGDETALHIDFDLPMGAIGGMGAEVRAVGTGVRIERVLAHTPAARVGLRPGERVMAVDGEETAHMSTMRFVRRLTGPPGTPVVLTVVDRDARVRHVAVVREQIPADAR